MRVIVAGAGSLGCLYAGKLSAVAEVALFTSWRERAQAVREHGLVIDEGDMSTTYHVGVASDVSALPGEADFILLCTKMDTLAAKTRQLQAAIDGTFVSIQNGIAHIDLLQNLLGTERLLFAPTYQAARFLDLRTVRRTGVGETVVWAPDDGAARGSAQQLLALLRSAGMEARYDEDGVREIWLKFGVTASVNAVCALLRRRLGALGRSSAAGQVVTDVAAEVVEVACREGVQITREELLRRIQTVVQSLNDAVPSILQDLQARRPTEVEWINGYLANRGSSLGVAVPLNTFLYQFIHAAECTYDDDVERVDWTRAENQGMR